VRGHLGQPVQGFFPFTNEKWLRRTETVKKKNIQHDQGFCHSLVVLNLLRNLPSIIPPNVYFSVEIRIFIMPKNSRNAYFDFCTKDHCIGIKLRRESISASIATLLERATFYPENTVLNPLGGNNLYFIFKISIFYFFTFECSFILCETLYYLTWKCKQITHQCR
jgi:hypothetical protein